MKSIVQIQKSLSEHVPGTFKELQGVQCVWKDWYEGKSWKIRLGDSCHFHFKKKRCHWRIQSTQKQALRKIPLTGK